MVIMYTYNSEYLGAGINGFIGENLYYWSEIIHQTGESYVFDERRIADINAWAGDFGASYSMDVPMSPLLECEYAFGSGDPDSK